MANSDWAREPKPKPKMSEAIAFDKLVHYLLMDTTCGDYWYLSRVFESPASGTPTAEIVFLNRYLSQRTYSHKVYVTSLTGFADCLKLNRCPLPTYLTAILREYEQDGDGSAAVNFYTQSGSPF
jgi:hypothetical protein